MIEEYTPRLYEPGDEAQIVPLLKQSFKIWPFYDITCTPEEHWIWRYNPPTEERPLIFLLEHQGKIIACGHHRLNTFKIKEDDVLASYGTDLCVSPDYHGKGLSKILVTYTHQTRKNKGVEFVYIVTVNPVVVNSSIRKTELSDEFPCRIKYLSRIEDIAKHVQATEGKQDASSKIKQVLNRVRLKRLAEPDPSIMISRIREFDDRIEPFLNTVNKHYDFILKSSKNFLNWRYCDPRGGDYVVYVAEESDTMLGYAVYRINKLSEYHVGYVVDFLTLPRVSGVDEALLLSGLRYFRENDVNKIDYQVVEGHPYDELFQSYGFSGGEGNRFIFYTFQGDRELDFYDVDESAVHFPFGVLTGI